MRERSVIRIISFFSKKKLCLFCLRAHLLTERKKKKEKEKDVYFMRKSILSRSPKRSKFQMKSE